MKINLKDLEKTVWNKKIYIILITIIITVTAIGYALTNVKYVATEKILLGVSDNTGLIDTYKEIIKGSSLLEEVILNLGLDMTAEELGNFVEVNKIDNTDMLEINVSGQDAQTTKIISAEISKVFVETVDDIYGNKELYSVDSSGNYYNCGNVTVIGIISLIVGFFASNLFFMVCYLLDNKIKGNKEIEKITGLKSLIFIPKIKSISKSKLNIKNIRIHNSEIFKNLMTNIQFVNADNLHSKSIVITSSKAFEGKTYVANNLAIEFAKAGKKVILIDADMRRGKISKIYNLPNDLGFSNYLSHLDSNGNVINERITRFIKDTEIKNLNVITAGNVPPNPTELLKTDKIKELIKDLKVFYDIIIFDTVPVLETLEPVRLSEVSDLTLLLSSYGKTKRDELTIAYNQISNVEGSVVGIGVNKVPDGKFKKNIANFKNIVKRRISNFFKKVLEILLKVKKASVVFEKLLSLLTFLFGLIVAGFVNVKNLIKNFLNMLKNKSDNVKEYIKKYKAQKEKIKLIEAGSVIVDIEENNIVKEVFESQIAKQLENEEKVQPKEELKTIIEEKNEKENVQNVKKEIKYKSKFELMKEQQEKENYQDISNVVEEQKEDNDFYEKEEQEEIEETKGVIIEQKNLRDDFEQKKIKKEDINYEEIDFQNPENLTEEMIRKQVEMDEMIMLAKREEEQEALKAKKMKLIEKIERKKVRKEKIENFKSKILENIKERKLKNAEKEAVLEEERAQKRENKLEERMKKQAEKDENKARNAKIRDEKRAYKEQEKQKHKEELRIKEELQEDNLYPRPRM